MNIGYACQVIGVPETQLRSCILKNATPETLKILIESNLNVLENIMNYNIENGIKLFRISSDVIPFGSHPVNVVKWWDIFSEKLRRIGEIAQANHIRLSMHPGQYTILNSTNEKVVQRAVEDLRYHCRFLDVLGVDTKHKLILHIGGVYGDKAAAVDRFVRQYRLLDQAIRCRLVIENDDQQYTIEDVLEIGNREGIPVVFDHLHHQLNPSDSQSMYDWISDCAATWRAKDGPQKIHYSQQKRNKRPGSHSDTVDLGTFLDFCRHLKDPMPNIMLEVKDKNLSAIKCSIATGRPKMIYLEKEWSRYKYLVLERAPNCYKQIRELLKDKSTIPVVDFYALIDRALASSVSQGNAVNAAQHVWGYFSKWADKKARIAFEKHLNKVKQGQKTTTLKKLLWNLAVLQQQSYLLDSLYFFF